MSAAATEHLPEDLIILQILTRLPIKSLIRFSCVSKRWSSIILSDPQFAKKHFKLASEQNSLSQRLLLSTRSQMQSLDVDTSSFVDDSSVRNLTCPFKQPGHFVKMLGSCNGMVCVALDFHDGYYIWNPSTGLFLKLPNPNFASEGVISFDPKMPDSDRSKTIIGPHYWGFGYVSATDDYKVVVEARFSDFKMHVEVFSSRANSWKRIESTLTVSSVYHSFTKTRGALSNETLHWLHAAWPRAPECYRLVIAAFDLTKEEFREIPLPVFKGDGTSLYSFIDVGVVSGGCLCVCRYEGQSKEHIQLWVMREYDVHESWTKLFRLTVNTADYMTRRLFFQGDSSIVMLKFNAMEVENELERIYLQCKDVGDCCDRYSLGMGLCDVIQYEETLLWLNDSHGLNERSPDTRINTFPESKQK
ncbi:hypothetical protein ABKV19_007669 [Rosa sericea]